jgi:hypothetical protein
MEYCVCVLLVLNSLEDSKFHIHLQIKTEQKKCEDVEVQVPSTVHNCWAQAHNKVHQYILHSFPLQPGEETCLWHHCKHGSIGSSEFLVCNSSGDDLIMR